MSVVVYHVQEDGWTKVSQTDVKSLHYQYEEEKNKEIINKEEL